VRYCLTKEFTVADKKISALTAATTPLAGTEVLPIVQSSATVKVAVDDLTVKNVRSNSTSGLLQVTGPAAASTRVMTTPDANFTVARTDAAQTFTGNQTFSGTLAQTGAINTLTNDFSARSASMALNDTLTISNLTTGVIEISEMNFFSNIAIIAVSGAATAIVYRSDLATTITAGNVGTLNVYRSGANVIIENKNAATLQVRTNIRKLG
jgi:hypothetical protein